MDMIKKEINQNPQRYSTKSDRYQISASPDIKPLDLLFGTLPEGLLPVLEVDGIIVNVGEYKLVSQSTLDLIKKSNNPHYDIRKNGEVKTTSNKTGSIGLTIPSITLNTSNLISVGKDRDRLNRIGGVTEVTYVYEGSVISDTTLTQNLVDQINYTLNKDINRPEDEYTLAELKLSDEKYYDITGLTITTSQSDENIFDYTKLAEFLKGVKERISALNKDFNIIKDIHYKGEIPSDFPTYVVKRQATAEDVQEDGDFNIVTKTSELVSVEKTTTQTLQEEQLIAAQQLKEELEDSINEIKNELEIPGAPKPTIEKWRLRKRRNLKVNGMGIYPTANFENFNFAKNRRADKKQGTINEGETFTGYLFKSMKFKKVTQNIWAIQSTPDSAPTGYAYQGFGDLVDKA